MDITLVTAPESFYRVEPAGKYLAEYWRDAKNKYLIHIQLFDPQTNTTWEIAKERHLIDFVEIVNGIWNSKDVYYATFEILEDMQMQIFLYRYNTETREETELLTFLRDMDAISGNTRIKVFLLSETSILVQTEVRKNKSSQQLMGNIAFSLQLYNLETKTDTAVSDSNLINNGINIIIPISEKKVMVKTGYSYLEDSRFNGQIRNESLIESVYITTLAKFIADITISAESLDMTLIESTYSDKHITRPSVTGAFTHFTVADPENQITKCIFFQNDTEERVEYSLNSFDAQDLYITHVVHQIPYVRKKTEDEVQFFNLKSALTDLVFYDESFLGQKGDVFVLASRKEKQKLHIYTYPGLKRTLEEKGTDVRLALLNNTYYLYITRETRKN